MEENFDEKVKFEFHKPGVIFSTYPLHQNLHVDDKSMWIKGKKNNTFKSVAEKQ